MSEDLQTGPETQGFRGGQGQIWGDRGTTAGILGLEVRAKGLLRARLGLGSQ